MTREEIIRLARQAGFSVSWPETVPNFERFAALVASAEREACAQMFEGDGDDYFWRAVAAKIRARGEE